LVNEAAAAIVVARNSLRVFIDAYFSSQRPSILVRTILYSSGLLFFSSEHVQFVR
jgi:hypothetical protein